MQFEKTMFLSLKMLQGSNKNEPGRPVLVNLMNVKKIVSDNSGAWCKITYMDGTVETAVEPFGKVEAALLGLLEGAYRAPEPKDP